ncbi:MAG: ABC transporter permease subunit [Candidatus Obscuribacter sp.]|jgi:NitT/TauT family transport system permease protein|nr:ABC transporter permease subunit [Candidatus Obscuribacter sp.]MDQ5964989.1 transporter permease subunit [Cyanobacteriota bacterium erpe_2018_sw_39hr_WHONDRS-SW48-000098_B_bin.30]MBK7840217.1 ABC transporter permease subunit [Candidatus Obscuribacter sp.]MBK9770983.1 ABC transporter permease subunit [Candidatus Obscuribacter sp.]MBL0186518.1 ABC transporter permease subunit [Candidatus Obscuribacter sp.]
MRSKNLFRSDSKLPTWINWALGLLPFVLLIAGWLWGAHYLRFMEINFPDMDVASSKLMPLPGEMWDGFIRTIDPDRNHERRLVLDMGASIERFGTGLAISALGIFVGLYMGTFPILEALCYRFLIFVDKIPPMLVAFILAMVLGVGEEAKIALVVFAVTPGLTLEAFTRTKEIAREQIFKAQTLGATETEIAWRILFPQILPKMIGSLRSNFKSAWGYVIAAESISAFAGIGFRVGLLKRTNSMDVIIPYVIIATLFMFLLDYLFQWLESRCPGEKGGK